MKYKLKPLPRRVHVKVSRQKKKDSGLILPDTAEKSAETGYMITYEVVAVFEAEDGIRPPRVAVGDHIVMQTRALGTQVGVLCAQEDTPDVEHIIVDEGHIAGILERVGEGDWEPGARVAGGSGLILSN